MGRQIGEIQKQKHDSNTPPCSARRRHPAPNRYRVHRQEGRLIRAGIYASAVVISYQGTYRYRQTPSLSHFLFGGRPFQIWQTLEPVGSNRQWWAMLAARPQPQHRSCSGMWWYSLWFVAFLSPTTLLLRRARAGAGAGAGGQLPCMRPCHHCQHPRATCRRRGLLAVTVVQPRMLWRCRCASPSRCRWNCWCSGWSCSPMRQSEHRYVYACRRCLPSPPSLNNARAGKN